MELDGNVGLEIFCGEGKKETLVFVIAITSLE
jgi:hypothetical protein